MEATWRSPGRVARVHTLHTPPSCAASNTGVCCPGHPNPTTDSRLETGGGPALAVGSSAKVSGCIQHVSAGERIFNNRKGLRV